MALSKVQKLGHIAAPALVEPLGRRHQTPPPLDAKSISFDHARESPQPLLERPGKATIMNLAQDSRRQFVAPLNSFCGQHRF